MHRQHRILTLRMGGTWNVPRRALRFLCIQSSCDVSLGFKFLLHLAWLLSIKGCP